MASFDDLLATAMFDSVGFEAERPAGAPAAAARQARFTAYELAAEAGISPQLLVDAIAAFGLAPVDPAQRRLGEADRALARRLRSAIDAGVEPERLIDANRVVGRAMKEVAGAARLLGDDVTPTIEHALSLHLHDLVRREAIDAAALGGCALSADRPVGVGYADLVGLGWLGAEMPADELGRVARHLEELVRETTVGPVRLVKTVAGAVVLVSPAPVALVQTLLSLVEAVGAEADRAVGCLPRLHAGVAFGEARELDGDVYGHAVNVASRLTAISRPGSVLADAATHDAVGREVAWAFAGERAITGLPGQHKLFRARRPPVRASESAPESSPAPAPAGA